MIISFILDISGHQKIKLQIHTKTHPFLDVFFWCAEEDLNLHGANPTSTSS